MSIIFWKISGDFNATEIISAVNSALPSPNAEKDFRVLLDNRNIGRPATTKQIEAMANLMERWPDVFRGSKWAAVVTDDTSYGMIRMLSFLVDHVPIEVDVFRDYDAAIKWLNNQ
jgi:hypothetical protein